MRVPLWISAFDSGKRQTHQTPPLQNELTNTGEDMMQNGAVVYVYIVYIQCDIVIEVESFERLSQKKGAFYKALFSFNVHRFKVKDFKLSLSATNVCFKQRNNFSYTSLVSPNLFFL